MKKCEKEIPPLSARSIGLFSFCNFGIADNEGLCLEARIYKTHLVFLGDHTSILIDVDSMGFNLVHLTEIPRNHRNRRKNLVISIKMVVLVPKMTIDTNT